MISLPGRVIIGYALDRLRVASGLPSAWKTVGVRMPTPMQSDELAQLTPSSRVPTYEPAGTAHKWTIE